jgi:hypothetical protein
MNGLSGWFACESFEMVLLNWDNFMEAGDLSHCNLKFVSTVTVIEIVEIR